MRPLSIVGLFIAATLSVSATAQNADSQIEEVVVSAQKRSERLQDVPVPVTALNSDALVNQNQLRLQDYYSSVPGLDFASDRRGNASLSIRGLTTGGGAGNPTVGVVVDDVPYGSSTSYGGGGGPLPDIDPSELARVEVLRGPQGTLYGASSLGGLVKFVTVDPSVSEFSGRVQLGTNSVHNGDGLGFNARGMVNMPLSDTLALRASAFSRRDPGYIDDPTLDKKGVNETDVRGGRLSLLWQMNQAFSLRLSALMQRTKADGVPDVIAQPGLGDLQQSALRGTGRADKKIAAYSATLNAQLGASQLTSITAYNRNTNFNIQDITPAFGELTQLIFGTTGTPLEEHTRTGKFTQELRVATPIGERFDWLLGAFYTHESSHVEQDILVADTATGTVVDAWLFDTWPSTYSEYALFTDLTVKFTERLNVQFGARESQNRQSYQETLVGPYDDILVGLPSPIVSDDQHTKDHSFTYLVTPQLKLSSDLMLYARLASGYRPGGPNPVSSVYHLPSRFEPDTTKNYEIGVKGSVLDRRLSFDASIYFIDWKDIQLTAVDPVTFQSFYVNASRAQSKGVELSVEARPISALKVSSWVAWNKATLTQDFPAGSASYGVDGDRLPQSARLSANLAADYEWLHTGTVTAFLGGTVSYVGKRLGVFTATPDRQEFPAYTRTDARAGFAYDTWTANLYVSNLTDRRGLIGGGLGNLNPLAFNYIQPRTLGLSVAKTF